MTRILNFGSLNVDHVYSVDAIAGHGETIKSLDYIVNQIEAERLTESFTDSKCQVQVLCEIIGLGEVALTLGMAGSIYFNGRTILSKPVVTDAPVVDTTGASDIFLRFFLAALAGQENPECARRRASAAAALCVARSGAMDSIPKATEIDSKLDSR